MVIHCIRIAETGVRFRHGPHSDKLISMEPTENNFVPTIENSDAGSIVTQTPRTETTSFATDREQHLFDPQSTERTTYEPYSLREKERRDMGKERGRFEEWEHMDFKEFISREEFKSPEAVIAYFLDHPKVNIKDTLTDLFLDNNFDSFVTSHFKDKTKLNAKALSDELNQVVAELIILRGKVVEKNAKVNEVGSKAIEHHLGYEPPKIETNRTLFVPSVDVYNYIAHGVSTDKLRSAHMGSNGIASYPVVAEGASGRTIRRIAVVPLSFGIDVDTTRISINPINDMTDSEVDSGKKWFDVAIKNASHEDEHARVYGKVSETSGEIMLGFKSLPQGIESTKPIETRKKEKSQDEGMTDFISIWKQIVADGNLSVDASFDDVVSGVRNSLAKGAYFSEVTQVIEDMQQYREKVGADDPLQYFLSNYYNSSQYPSAYLL